MLKFVIAVCALLAGPLAHGQAVDIDSGKVEGKVLASGVRAWLGIPYAAAPVRELRWREPQPVAKWRGVLHADRLGPECIQVLRRHNLNHYFGEEATSEDCLYMNVWAPARAKASAKLPVVVFIYGGGFTLGSSGMAMYNGENLARKGAVFINFNYRVGALGFMAHPELTAESPYHASGNYGLLDQVAALEWVKRNVAKFGGDPGNVTISGQSAGSLSISALAASPLARGLFQRGFGMSFSLLDSRFPLPSLADSERSGISVQKAVGVNSLAELRTLPADKLLAVQKDCQFGCAGTVQVWPNVDGHFLPAQVADIYAKGEQNDVPLVSGFVRDESSNELRTAKNLVEYRDAAHKLFGGQAERFLSLYPASSDAEAATMGALAAREGQAELSSRRWAAAQTSTGKAPFYMYMFSRVHPFAEGVTFYDNPKAIGAYHTSDVPYWFGTQDAFNLFRVTRNWSDYDRALSDRMMNSLLAFARTGNPATSATPWPRWTKDQPHYQEFGDVVQTAVEDNARMQFHTPSTLTRPTPRLSGD